jgi:hypothetical protein
MALSRRYRDRQRRSAIAGSSEVNPWTSASNLGDMFTAENASWGGFMIPAILPGGTAVWHDDTDRIVVPEPAALSLTAAAAWLILALCRRKLVKLRRV